MGFEKNKAYAAVGISEPGKRSIEGLLPDSVKTTVYQANPGLVAQATSGTKDEQDKAKQQLKKLYLDEFKKSAKPGNDFFGKFYPLVRIINKALQ